MILQSVISIIIMLGAVVYLKKTNKISVVNNARKVSITDDRLNDMILPNNKGRSLDDVCDNIKATNISVGFRLNDE